MKSIFYIITCFWWRILFCSIALSTIMCRFPYEPEPEPGIIITDNVESDVSVYSLVGTAQICNPSISQDTDHFPACMLWLNFSGELPVVVPDSLAEYSGISNQHDRLTIIDTSNTLRWFIQQEELGADEREEFQDPEWSSHPEYIVCLLSKNARSEWSSYVIHAKSHKYVMLCNGGLNQTSTPHLWVEQAAPFTGEWVEPEYDEEGFADTATVKEFFGTLNTKFVVAKKEGSVLSLYFKDYSTGSSFVPLKRPADREGWNCESPLISPDGNWIVFNAYKSEDFYEVYLQKLSPESSPLLFASGASDPHWWVHPFDDSMVFVIYQEASGWNLVQGDLSDKKYLTGELGVTYRQQVRLFPEATNGATALVKTGLREALVNLPTKGGLSPDGRFLCTGYARAFMVELP